MRAVAESSFRCTYSLQPTHILPPWAMDTTAVSTMVALEEVPPCGAVAPSWSRRRAGACSGVRRVQGADPPGGPGLVVDSHDRVDGEVTGHLGGLLGDDRGVTVFQVHPTASGLRCRNGSSRPGRTNDRGTQPPRGDAGNRLARFERLVRRWLAVVPRGLHRRQAPARYRNPPWRRSCRREPRCR